MGARGRQETPEKCAPLRTFKNDFLDLILVLIGQTHNNLVVGRGRHRELV